jgi:hypothetical protein
MRSLAFLAAAVVAPVSIVISDASAQQFASEGEVAGTKIIVRDIRRNEGGTVTVRLQLVNETDEPKVVYKLLGRGSHDWVHLIDVANKKRYLVVTDRSGNKCECTDGAAHHRTFSKDSPMNLWAKFPAPPAEVRELTVVVKSFEPIESVPITER